MAELVVAGVTAVVVGRDVLERVLDGVDGTIAVLCQPSTRGLAERIAAAAAGSAVIRVLPDGDAAKSLSVVEDTASWLAANRIRRDGTLVAVGGGALTDVAGFVGAVYMRGIPVRYVPTTLLGAIDAAIGGKTAVNVGGKNLVGTFTHPAAVIVDLEVVGAIGPELLAEGMAEALKAGAIGDPELFALLEADGAAADLGTVVERAIAVKASIVAADFREAGVRAHLNFGHTVGHAIETSAGWRHGPSVAVGMVAAAAASARLAEFDEPERIEAAVRDLGLPTRAPALDPDQVLGLIAVDKKGDADGIRMVLLERLGAPVVSHVDSATLDAALAAVGIGGS